MFVRTTSRVHTTCQKQNACATGDVPDAPMYHTSRSRAHVWEHATWILDTMRLKFKLNFKCVQSTVRTSKRRKVTMIYFEYKYWVHMYVRESTARSLFYIQRHVPRIDGTEFKFTYVRTMEKNLHIRTGKGTRKIWSVPLWFSATKAIAHWS